MSRISAGVLLYRWRNTAVEVLIAHPGGPFWAKRDRGVWSIPKGEIAAGEDPLATAIREFGEETGQDISHLDLVALGTIRQRSGKVVHGFAAEGEFDPDHLISNPVEIRGPSGRSMTIPEIDRVLWASPRAARRRLITAQIAFVDRLLERLDPGSL